METNTNLKYFLQENSSFNLDEIEFICSKFHSQSLGKEELLFEKGTRFSKIVFVEKGILRSYIYDDEGNEIIKTFISQNEFFAEIESFENGAPCSFNVSAVIPCKLLTLSKADSDLLARKLPKWEIAIRHAAMDAMNSMIRKQEFLLQGEAIDKYGYFVKHFPELAKQIPLKYIAAYLQITQSSLSRIRRKDW